MDDENKEYTCMRLTLHADDCATAIGLVQQGWRIMPTRDPDTLRWMQDVWSAYLPRYMRPRKAVVIPEGHYSVRFWRWREGRAPVAGLEKNEADLALLRSPHYANMSPREQWAEDKRLGLLDWPGTESPDGVITPAGAAQRHEKEKDNGKSSDEG